MKVTRQSESKRVAAERVPVSSLFMRAGDFFIRVESSILNDYVEAVNVGTGQMAKIDKNHWCVVVDAEIVIK